MKSGWGIILAGVLCAGLVSAGGGLKSRKAQKLVAQAMPMIKRGTTVYKDWILDRIPREKQLDALSEAVKIMDDGCALLQKALDIEEHGGVIHQLSVAARYMQKMRFQIEFRLKPRLKKPAPPDKEKPAETPDKNKPDNGTPEPAPKPDPQPGPKRPTNESPERDPVDRAEETNGTLAFENGMPPASPVDRDLGIATGLDHEKYARKQIEAALRAHFQSRRPNKLHARHKLCRGKGSYPDGTACDECCATGHLINEYHFRKVYWNSYSPLLRDADGAKDALARFFERARRKPDLLGAPIRSFKVTDIAFFGHWAKAKLELNTTAGKKESTITLIGLGRSWFFYHPEADRSLLPAPTDTEK